MYKFASISGLGQTFSKFIIYSIMFHTFSFFALFFVPAEKVNKPGLFFVDIVSSENAEMTGEYLNLPDFASVETFIVPVTSENNSIGQFSSISGDQGNLSQEKQQTEPANEQQDSMQNTMSGNSIIPPGTGFSTGLRRENFFDRRMFEKAGQEDYGFSRKNTIIFNVGELPNLYYLKSLKRRLEGLWEYPYEAALSGIKGDLYLSITINKDGSLKNIELLKSSGDESLDEAAIMAIKKASPFDPLPTGWLKEDLTITGHFIYAGSKHIL